MPERDHQTIEIEECPAFENETARSAAGSIEEDQQFIPRGLTSPQRNCLDRVRRRLEESERPFQAQASSFTIFKIPPVLREINPKAGKPELVSIGPYHWRDEKFSEFEKHKSFFLKRFIRRTESNEVSLINLVTEQESSARGCYSELPEMSDFLDMMLLDGCFVVELLLHIFRKGGEIDKDDPIHPRERIIPILIRDLLKLENQVPYSLLQSLFDSSSSTRIEAKTPHLCMLALRVFNLVYPSSDQKKKKKNPLFPRPNPDEYTDRQYRHYDEIKKRQYKHLLDLFNFTLSLTNPVHGNREQKYRPSDQSIPCVTQLRPSGIKFKSKKTDSFLDISFRKGVLKIPSFCIDDFMITVLINCTALEQCLENNSKYVTDYVSFMQCLINQPKDVSHLCSDGIIISTLSYDDQYVTNLFNKLGENIIFNVRDCYLSNEFKELESYYYSNWASMIRTYFSSPWSAISAFSAFLLLALTITQTVYAILGQLSR